MLLSISYKLIDVRWFAPRRAAARVPDQIGPEHILQALQEQAEHLLQLKTAVAGSEEGSLVGQFKLLRSDIGDIHAARNRARNDFETRLFAQFKEFANILARSATETIIEALRQVIVDFNKNLTEQFGDNFKRLDESVGKMVVWQDRYRTHVEEVEARISTAVAALEHTRDATESISHALQKSEQAISGVRAACEQIPATMASLQAVMRVNQHQITELERHLDAFAAVRDKAVDAVPQIQARLDEVSSQLQTGIQAVANAFQKSVATIAGIQESIQRNIDNVLNNIQTSIEGTLKETEQAVQRTNTRIMGAVEDQVREAAKKAAETLNAQLKAMNQAIERELHKVLSELGSALATISARIANDHAEMTRLIQEWRQK